ncbi:beta-N-acetylglucosaminidase domain-containing protein [Congregibacter sp.]|uniref:beta-N-acetylglucosaminidase domain-containing protein n=1 Tax=Congregibacter sp. TaxID=2744308 RepID=UPI0038583945
MKENKPTLGVIEGFYGRAWSSESRLHMAQWLPAIGIHAYLYAPKADAFLRKSWHLSWPDSQRMHLLELANACASNQLEFHVGLSPFELYRDYGGANKEALKSKLGEVVDLGVSGVAILFDDMPGSLDSLAARQAEICNDLRHWSSDADLALRVCPTYYSDDPILDEIFGARPGNYLEELYGELEGDFEMFWTGPQVCSDSLEPEAIRCVSDSCKGNVAIWDNYPVNDSRARSPHIYVDPLQGRAEGLRGLIGSHWCNAMNQPALSLPALASLPALYGVRAPERDRVLEEAGTDQQMVEACMPLSRSPLNMITDAERHALALAASRETMAASELRDWLSGGYEFDPDCLTS